MDLEQFNGLPKGEYHLADDGSAFVYALNERGTNRFWLKVDRGWIDEKTRTSNDEVMALARAIVALPALLSELAAARAEAASLRGVLASLSEWIGENGDRQIVITARDPQLGGGFHAFAEDDDKVAAKDDAPRVGLSDVLAALAAKLEGAT